MLFMTRWNAAAVAAMCVMLATGAAAQSVVDADHPYGFDPYKPSDAAVLREYGATLALQSPTFPLDRYRPSHAALIRQLGPDVPLWLPEWALPGQGAQGPGTVDCNNCEEGVGLADGQPWSPVTLGLPRSNDGVWIRFNDRIWISAGPAVALSPASFTQIGERAGAAVYKRTDASDDVIYVPMRRDLVAPFRAKP